MSLIGKVFGTRNDRNLKKYNRIVQKINSLSDKMKSLTDDDIKLKRQEHLIRANKEGHSEALLVESFALVREASERSMHMRHYDVQLIGGLALNDCNVAELRTGEGKTLVATLPAYYNSLFGPVHLVTVNEYLANRDSELMRPLYEALGLSVSALRANMPSDQRREMYRSDVVYATSSDFGFDYLRDHLAQTPDELVQRGYYYALVDELDSVLIDEARTPLVISGASDVVIEDYKIVRDLAETMEASDGLIVERELKKYDGDISKVDRKDVVVNSKDGSVELTEKGFDKAEAFFLETMLIRSRDEMYKQNGLKWLHLLRTMIQSIHLKKRDRDYIVNEKGEIIIIDENTGRLMEGRRWNDGIHQCIETLEDVEVFPENVNMASTSIQNYFLMYEKLSGMTGTADTEAVELKNIYDLEVIVVPTNKKILRTDEEDKIFKNFSGKIKYILQDIIETHEKGQPILVGTSTVHMSEFISKQLTLKGIEHNVLNAKKHEKEAHIIAQAGRPGAITISTNMAGRGTDIILGGNANEFVNQLNQPSQPEIDAVHAKCKEDQQKVIELGGLRVIGTERHESRRIDNQLIGRAGRQGDPGSSIFYLSLEDDMLKKFITDKHRKMIDMLGMDEDECLSFGMLNKAVRGAQQSVENLYYEMRKELLKFDNIINEQRTVIYKHREEVLQSRDMAPFIYDEIDDLIDTLTAEFIDINTTYEHWNIEGLENALKNSLALQSSIETWSEGDEAKMDYFEFKERLAQELKEITNRYAELFGTENMSALARASLLNIIDTHWRDHIELMAGLKDGIHLRGYSGKDPQQEYKREAFDLYKSMMENINGQFISVFFINAKKMVDMEMARQAQIKVNEEGSVIIEHLATGVSTEVA